MADADGGMSGGEVANILGTSLLGYFAGRKGQKRQGEIAERAAMLSDPWAKQRKYYMGILGDMYGMPEGYTDRPPESGEPSNELMKLLEKFGGGATGGGLLGGLIGGPGGALTGGGLGGLFG